MLQTLEKLPAERSEDLGITNAKKVQRSSSTLHIQYA
jgi:hypothetical protein